MPRMGRTERFVIWSMAVLMTLSIAAVPCTQPALAAGFEGPRQMKVKGEWTLPRHYPDGFDGIGTINRIGDGEIVIDDRLYRLGTGLRCATFRERAASFQRFRPGQQVGFVLSDPRVIATLWSLAPGELERAVKSVGPPPPQREPVRPVPVKPSNRLPAAP